MEFKCFECLEIFSDGKSAIKHLKVIHFIKDNTNPIYCLKNNGCKNHFSTFRNLKKHMNSCYPNEVLILKYSL